MIVGVFGDIDFDDVAGFVEQGAAVGAQVAEVEAFAGLLVAFGEVVDGFEARLVVDAAEVEVDDDIVRVFVRGEEVSEAGDGSEEEDAVELIDLRAVLVELRVGDEVLALIPGEDERGEGDADEDRGGEVVHEDGVGSDGDHDEDLGDGDASPGLESGPLEGADDDHEHDADERGHGDGFDVGGEEEDEGEEGDGGGDAGESAPATGFHIDEGLADHGAAAHAAEDAADDVGDALAAAFLV